MKSQHVGNLSHAAYIERPGAGELSQSAADQNGNWENGLPSNIENIVEKASIFTNISDDPQERIDYWRLVEERESTPRTHALFLKPTVSLDWWEALPTTTALDKDFRIHALQVAEKYRQWVERRATGLKKQSEFQADPFTCSAEQAGRLIEQVRAMQGADPEALPLWFESGRGGRIQFRIVGELPCEISPEARAEIVSEFCHNLAHLEERAGPDGELRTVGMMYTAVIHAPDRHNDHRNCHLHVVAHDRPATLIEHEDGRREWEFCRARRVRHGQTPEALQTQVSGRH